MRTLLIGLIFWLLLCNCSNEKFTFRVQQNYCGQVFIIANLNTEVINYNLIVDSLGIAYVSELALQGQKEVLVLQGNKDITEECRNFKTGYITLKNGAHLNYTSFYIPCIEEKTFNEKYWEEMSRSNTINNKLNDLVEKGVINL